MGIIRKTASVLLLLGLLSPGLFASGFENTGMGTKARGMGGAFRAIADDWTAAYYNPAGYAFIKDNELGGAYGFKHNRDELSPDYVFTDDYGSVYETGVYNDRVLYNQHLILGMPSAGFVVRLPVWGETVFGLSGYQPYDNHLVWTVFEPLLAYNNATGGLPADQIKNDLDVVAFQLTAAREFSEDKLSIGVGLQVLRADVFLKNLNFRSNPLPSPLSDRPYDLIPELSSNDGSGWGFGFKAGLLYKVNEKLNVALTANVPFEITVDGTTQLDYVMPRNEFLVSDGNPNRYYPADMEYAFVAGDIMSLAADYETKLKLPTSFGGGFAYMVNDKLTVALDAEYTLWSKFEGLSFTYSNLTGLTSVLSADPSLVDFFGANLSYPVTWDDAGRVMLGAEYILNRNISLVGGTSYDQSPVRSGTDATPLFVDPGDRYGFNGGLLVNVQQWDVGFVTSYFYYPDDQTVSGVRDLNNDGIIDNFPGTYSASTFETVLSVNYRF